MPCLRGIDVKLVTYPAKQIIQEYPHPDGISLRLVTRQEAAAAFAKGLSTASASPSSSEPAVPSRKVDPKSSVYISTQPGSQFIIAYDIHEVPDACKFLNFKVFINGRHMVTCGQDLNQRTRGVICQTLWAPSNNHYAGIEGREFMFLPDKTKKSAAEDGGLIEVQVHRAAARSLRSPSLQEFRQAREYGLATPSTGLIQRPEEVKWYKYHLVDAKDTPVSKSRSIFPRRNPVVCPSSSLHMRSRTPLGRVPLKLPSCGWTGRPMMIDQSPDHQIGVRDSARHSPPIRRLRILSLAAEKTSQRRARLAESIFLP
ncbi:hypothetical protein CONLIGDRAFT_352577 [Coniochaeta ligniaria NRRL 30616]|uniref:Uncharacterized protein n=1 Tax=Coniochaeta ligniaria NRRL 30616 TaxID=1408157 RepID=A0A1J7JJD6_9PEZI|nr:hypothetical protein CONLIGDRAFT_352577 [Coniochaeta ligniaria NRRL 30616]